MSETATRRLPRIAQPWALKNLPPFRPIALKLARLAVQDDVPIGIVQKVLRTDAAFSAEVLRLANSALLGTRHEVSSVSHAVNMLGLDRLKALAMTVALRDILCIPKSNDAMQLCWKYNLATAIVSEWLAPFLAIAPDTGYTAGLIHDIGRLAILSVFPEEYGRLMSVIQDYGFDLLRCETDLFDIDHCEAGAWLLERWDFPNDLRDVAALHHGEPGPDTPPLVTVVYIAWQIADMLGFSPMGTRSAASIEEITATLPEAARRRIFSGLDGLAEAVSVKLNASESVQV